MILETALLTIKSGQEADFLSAMDTAKHIISDMPGFEGMTVRPSVANSQQFLLMVHWEKLEDHTVGFRGSERYLEWKDLLHHFYEPFPTVDHYGAPVVIG